MTYVTSPVAVTPVTTRATLATQIWFTGTRTGRRRYRPTMPAPDADVVAMMRVKGAVALDDHQPDETFGWQKAAAKNQLGVDVDAIAELQKRLFAERQRAVLIVLQAMDAGGKDGVIRSVMTGINPAGITIHSFGVPSDEESEHDFLWRIHYRCPRRGIIGVFNRSHYEAVLVERVKELVTPDVWWPRYGHIRDFEHALTGAGTTVVKLYLNVSYEEQGRRLQDRIDSPDEQWKFRRGDLDDRKLWPAYREAYTEALRETSTAETPWYVVPGDRKWVRDLAVAKILRQTLEQLDPQYPEPEEDLTGMVVT